MAEAPNSSALLDVARTVERLCGDEELFGEIAEILIRTAPSQIDAIRTALAGNDLYRAYEEAHSLKGAVAAFEAPEVLNSLIALEQNAKGPFASEAFAKAEPLVRQLLGELAPHVRAT